MHVFLLVRCRRRAMTAYGASSSLPLIPAKVALPNRQPPFRLGGRNSSSCPIPAICRRQAGTIRIGASSHSPEMTIADLRAGPAQPPGSRQPTRRCSPLQERSPRPDARSCQVQGRLRRKSIIAALTSVGRSSWVIWPQPGSIITSRSCGTNFGRSAMWRCMPGNLTTGSRSPAM